MSSTESDLTPPDLKRHISILTRNYYANLEIETEIETDSSSDTENQEDIGTSQISSYFPAIDKHSTMAEQQLYTADASPLLRLKDDMLQSMKDLDKSLKRIQFF